MREIKFREWDTEDKQMFYEVAYWGGKPADYQVIMQYTGMKDKNGKEIYEGDLFGKMGGDVERPDEYEIHAKVYFDEDLCAFCIDDNRGGWEFLSDYILRESNEREIIGNIYENPELLKGGTDEHQ